MRGGYGYRNGLDRFVVMDTLFPEVSFFFLVKQPLSSVQLRLKISIMGPKIESFKGRIDFILVFNCNIRDLKKFSLSYELSKNLRPELH